MFYIIQSNLFREEGYDKLINTLERFNLSYGTVKVLPYFDKVFPENVNLDKIETEKEFKTKESNIFVFGSLKLARLSKLNGWSPGAIITDNHDYEVYSKYYKENLLNYDSRIVKLGDDFEWEYEQQFIRPCLDSKVFTGKVFDNKSWNETRTMILSEGFVSTATNETLIQVAKPKSLTQEIRIWIVNGKIVTQSTYRRGSFLVYDNIVDEDALCFARDMIDIFQIAPAFVMDVGLTKDGWKIIECGSISCAGFYDADMQKIIFALEDLYVS